MHIKKNMMSTAWPIPRKPQKKRYIAVPSHAKGNGISILFILRDMLKIAHTRKEVKFMMLNGLVKINNQKRKDENFPVQVFDTINLEKAKKNYRLEIINLKFSLKEISEKESEKKIVKIIKKTILKKNMVQMNSADGRNILTKEKFSVGDSAIINTKTNKIEKILPLKKGAKIEVVRGKHAGKKGELKEISNLARGKVYTIKLESREVTLPYKTILVIN